MAMYKRKEPLIRPDMLVHYKTKMLVSAEVQIVSRVRRLNLCSSPSAAVAAVLSHCLIHHVLAPAAVDCECVFN